jgi:hypothetical protein
MRRAFVSTEDAPDFVDNSGLVCARLRISLCRYAARYKIFYPPGIPRFNYLSVRYSILFILVWGYFKGSEEIFTVWSIFDCFVFLCRRSFCYVRKLYPVCSVCGGVCVRTLELDPRFPAFFQSIVMTFGCKVGPVSPICLPVAGGVEGAGIRAGLVNWQAQKCPRRFRAVPLRGST